MGIFDALTADIEQAAQNRDQLRGLAAGGIIPGSAAPGPSLLSRLLGGDQQPAMPVPAVAPPPVPMAPQAAGPASVPSPVAANSGTPSSSDIGSYIAQAAAARGISPGIALKVAYSEGGLSPNRAGDGNSSFGPYQLHYGGVAGGGNSVAGLGDDFTKQTGLDARDPANWKATVDFALDHAAKSGWGAFHGAAKSGLDNFAGIQDGAVPVQMAGGDNSVPPAWYRPTRGPDEGPGTAVAGSPAAPQQQAAAPAAAATQQGFQQPSMDQVRALVINPQTRDLGLQLWKQAITGKNFGFMVTPDGTVVRTDPTTGTITPVYQSTKLQSVAAGSTLYDPVKNQAVYTAPAADKSTEKGFQIVQTGQDQFGNRVYGKLNKSTGDVTPMDQPTSASAPQVSADPNLHGQDFLDTLDAKTAGQVKAIVEGRAPYPTGMLLKTPYGQQLAAYVTQADPTFETGNATTRVKVRNEFNSGGPSSPAGMITAGNTAIQHLGHLSDAAEALDNGQLPLVNGVRNAIATNTGGGTAVTQFNNILGKYVEEATKFYRGSGGTEADIQRDLGNLSPNMSPAQLRTALQTQVELLQSKINALQDRWAQGMGPMVGKFPIIQPDSQTALDRIAQRAGIAPTNSSAQPQGQAGAGLGAQEAKAPVRVTTPDEAMKLPHGTPFMTPDGRLKVRP